MSLISIFLLTFCVANSLSTPLIKNVKLNVTASTCGPSSCHAVDSNKINVHLVAHTHDDVGWLKTVDQYYYGSNSNNQRAGVQYILDSVVKELIEDPNKKFIYVESAFFFKWWKDQNDLTKLSVIELVQEGRLEFISGGWSMNDEATCHYNSIIDQMTLGFRNLRDTFGQCAIPKIGWQIDPFGHSREQASLFANMFFDGLFFARMDYEDNDARTSDKRLELVWKGSDDLGKSSDLFTSFIQMGYGQPDGFCWDIGSCNDDPFIEDKESEDYNVDKLVTKFVNFAKDYASKFTTNHVLIPMGSDFEFQDAHSYFKNLDKLIKYVNKIQDDIQVTYSTPSCYLYSVHNANKVYSTKSDDFFPYASDPHSYWTGYFTSRPALKKYERVGNNFLQFVKQMDVLAGFPFNTHSAQINYLREAMGILQHHDGVSGTEKQHVANNYALKLHKAIVKTTDVLQNSYAKLIPKVESPAPIQVFCENMNISACEFTEEVRNFALTIYNPVGTTRTHTVVIPVTGNGYKIMDPTGKDVDAVLAPIPSYVQNIPGRVSKAQNELSFLVTMPPLGFATYIVLTAAKATKQSVIRPPNGNDVIYSGVDFKATFDGNSGAIKMITLADGRQFPFTSGFHYYKEMRGDNRDADHRASGAYVFRPDGSTPVDLSKNLQSKFVENDHFAEVHQKWNDWVSQTIRIYKSESFVEFDYVIGPIDISDNVGKEVIARFDSQLKSNSIFFTDANGRQVLKRQRNFRPTWKLNVTEAVSGNYYPVNSRIFLQDLASGQQMTVLNDRSQGGSSMADGSLEIMVHRRLLNDDAFGVGEALNETAYGKGLVIRGHHYMFFSAIKDAAKMHRDIGLKMYLRPMPSFSTLQSIPQDYYADYNTYFPGLTKDLPSNIHLLTLENWRDDQYLIRLEHLYQNNEDSVLSKPVTIQLKNMFTQFEIEDATEMTLGANQELSKASRLSFRTTDSNMNKIEGKDSLNGSFNRDDLSVTLYPMEIRTFVIKVKNTK